MHCCYNISLGHVYYIYIYIYIYICEVRKQIVRYACFIEQDGKFSVGQLFVKRFDVPDQFPVTFLMSK